MNKFVKTISTDRLEYEFLRSLNGLLDLTDRELELFSIFLGIYREEARSRRTKTSIDSTANRKAVMKLTGITRDNLCRYIQGFKEKQLFLKDSGIMSINKALVPVIVGSKTVQITMILKINENE